jgi:hypothetical protein
MTSASSAILHKEDSCPFKSSLFDYPRAWATTMKDCDDDISLTLLHTNQYEAKMRQKMLLAQAVHMNAIS